MTVHHPLWSLIASLKLSYSTVWQLHTVKNTVMTFSLVSFLQLLFFDSSVMMHFSKLLYNLHNSSHFAFWPCSLPHSRNTLQFSIIIFCLYSEMTEVKCMQMAIKSAVFKATAQSPNYFHFFTCIPSCPPASHMFLWPYPPAQYQAPNEVTLSVLIQFSSPNLLSTRSLVLANILVFPAPQN